ncbi:MFS transporter [Mycobacterium ulcerans]|uniref:MFS transporter n=1 Tax=Mycobacterium ulcerans TaxID=1809 RepID=UPI0038B894F5
MPESVTAPPELGIRHATPGLLALTIATCLAITTEILPVGLLPAIGHTFGVRDAVTGLLVSLYAVLVALLAVPLTVVTARFPRKPLLLTTLLGYAVSNTLVAIAPTFAMVAAGRAVGGVTHALFFSLCIGYAPRLVGLADVGRALALVGGGVSAGIVVGVPLLTSVGTAVGWRGAFAVLAVLAAVLLLVVAKLLPPVSSESAPPPAGTAKGRRRLAAVVSSNALTYTGQFTLYTFISAVLLAAGARPAFIGPLLLMCGVCSLAGLVQSGGSVVRGRHPGPQSAADHRDHHRRGDRRAAGPGCVVSGVASGGRRRRRMERRLWRHPIHLSGGRGARSGRDTRDGRGLGECHRQPRDRRRCGDRRGTAADDRSGRTPVGGRRTHRDQPGGHAGHGARPHALRPH